jgi:(S)-mandelate dehydrogenase
LKETSPIQRTFYAGRNFRHASTIEELRRVALRRLPRFAAEYLEGGSEDELTLVRNRTSLERLAWVPRMLAGVAAPATKCELLGETLALPLVIAPTGFNGMLWRAGDLALATAAHQADVQFTLSTAGNIAITELNKRLYKPAWFQLYPLRDPNVTVRLIDRAAEAGCDKLIVTVDVPALGAREWDRRNYRGSFDLSWSSKLDALMHPVWLKQVMLQAGAPTFANIAEFLPSGERSALQGARFLGSQINPALDWEDVERFRARWRGKLLLKGLLRVQDAKRALAAGCDGVVLGNHGGRQLDSCIAGIDVIEATRQAVGDRATILVEGGFRRGADVLKALALGADAVMLGRATLYGLAAGGEAGVTHALQLLRAEMERTLMLLGCRSIQALDAQFLERAA